MKVYRYNLDLQGVYVLDSWFSFDLANTFEEIERIFKITNKTKKIVKYKKYMDKYILKDADALYVETSEVDKRIVRYTEMGYKKIIFSGRPWFFKNLTEKEIDPFILTRAGVLAPITYGTGIRKFPKAEKKYYELLQKYSIVDYCIKELERTKEDTFETDNENSIVVDKDFIMRLIDLRGRYKLKDQLWKGQYFKYYTIYVPFRHPLIPRIIISLMEYGDLNPEYLYKYSAPLEMRKEYNEILYAKSKKEKREYKQPNILFFNGGDDV